MSFRVDASDELWLNNNTVNYCFKFVVCLGLVLTLNILRFYKAQPRTVFSHKIVTVAMPCKEQRNSRFLVITCINHSAPPSQRESFF